ncbi:hypothetical protein LT493_01815 [Streptomyces tricolor]|nr:hypothetical protein [Streptomyces tricolor]
MPFSRLPPLLGTAQRHGPPAGPHAPAPDLYESRRAPGPSRADSPHARASGRRQRGRSRWLAEHGRSSSRPAELMGPTGLVEPAGPTGLNEVAGLAGLFEVVRLAVPIEVAELIGPTGATE